MEKEERDEKVKKLVYRTSAQRIGERQEIQPKTKFGKSGNFSNHLLSSGMWRNNGLNCRVDTDKFIDGSKDWMDKIN